MNKTQHGEEGFNLTSLIETMPAILIVAIILGITQFLAMMNYISITAVSRDGTSAVFIKYIPLSLYRQFLYKSIPNIIMNIIMNLIVFAIVMIVVPIPILYLIVVLILSTLFNIIQSFLNLIIDLKKPKLKWDTEYAVVKQNMNLMWTMIFGMVCIGIIVGLTVIFTVANCNPIIAFSITTLFLIGVIYLLNRYIKEHQEELFAKIY